MSDQPDEITESVTDLVSGLRDLLGVKLVAYLGSARDTGTVAEWAMGEWSPDEATVGRLRTARQAAGLLLGTNSPAVIQAWFQGANAILGDRAPARVLAEDPSASAGQQVMAAARACAQPS